MNIGVQMSFPVSTLMNFIIPSLQLLLIEPLYLLEEIFWGFNLLSWIIELSVMSNSMGQFARVGSNVCCWLCLSQVHL